jgi:hypothetical protein
LSPGLSVDLAINRGNGVLDDVHLLDYEMDASKLIPAGEQLKDIQLKDVNGDLKPDLVILLSSFGFTDPGPSHVLVYLNTGTYPYFQVNDPLLFQIPSGNTPALSFDITDVNNDGLNDILVATEDFSAGGYLLLNTSPLKQPGIPVFLAAGAITGGNDVLNVQTPAANAVHGQVFDDVNRNGSQDISETGRAGSFVFVDRNRNGRHDAGEPAAVTRAHGLFAIPNLPDGTHSVGVAPEDGVKATTAAFVTAVVNGQTAPRIDFGRATRLIHPPAAVPVTAGHKAVTTLQPTPATAGRRLVFTLDPGAPAGAAIDPATGVFTWTPPVGLAAGTYRVTARVRDRADPSFTDTETVTVQVARSPDAVSLPVGADAGAPPVVQVYDAAGARRWQVTAFGAGFRGGVRVAAADLTGDGVPDVIAAAGPGGGPHVKVFDGATGAELRSFLAYAPAFRGGVYVAAGDVTGDGVPDIVTGAGAGGGPHVKVFDGATGAVAREWMAYSPSFRGGVTVAVGHVTGDEHADVVTGAGRGGGPHVKVFDGGTGAVAREFMAYDPAFRGGVYVAAGDVTGDGVPDIVTGAGAGGGPHVKVFDGATGPVAAAWMAYAAAFRGGVRVGAADLDGDGRADVITGAGPGGGPQVKAFAGATGTPVRSFVALDPTFLGGIFVA